MSHPGFEEEFPPMNPQVGFSKSCGYRSWIVAELMSHSHLSGIAFQQIVSPDKPH